MKYRYQFRHASAAWEIIRSQMCLDGMALRCKADAVVLRSMRRFLVAFADLV